jgi:hypothetical protein
MGTSTVHRSPLDAAHWRVVNNLYRDPSVERGRLVAEIFRAASKPYVDGLSGREVSERLRLLLSTWSATKETRSPADALSFARELIGKARDLEVREDLASFYSDLANRALHATVLAAFPTVKGRGSSRQLVQSFLANIVGTCIDHVVSRDLSAHLGTKNLPNTKAVLELTRELKAVAQHVAANQSLSKAIEATATSPEQRWADLISSAWSVGAATLESSTRRDQR